MSNSQLNDLKFAMKDGVDGTLNLSSSLIGSSNDVPLLVKKEDF